MYNQATLRATLDKYLRSYAAVSSEGIGTVRSAGGEILNSTYFSVESRQDQDGALSSLSIEGHGNGHGIGMCQWGAIGRARAGADYRTILRTYYPGTTVATVAR